MFVSRRCCLIALLVWIDRGAPRPRVYAVVAACVAAVLPALIPYERFLQLKVRSDTLMIVPLWNVQDHVGLPRLDEVVLLGGVVAAAALPARARAATCSRCPRSCSLYFALAIQPIQAGPHGMEQAAAGALFEGIRKGPRDWIDEAAGDGPVAVLWTGKTNRFTVLMNEFFNRSVGPVYTLGGPIPGGMPETAVEVDEETGEIRRAERRQRGRGAVRPHRRHDRPRRRSGRGRRGARGDALPRRRAADLDDAVTGVDNDLWSGPEVTYRRVRCRGGTLRVTLGSDPGAVLRAADGARDEHGRRRRAHGRAHVPAAREGEPARPAAAGRRRLHGAVRDLADGRPGRRRPARARRPLPRVRLPASREDRLRRQPALASADGRRQLRPRLARRARRGRGRGARDRRVRADEPGRAEGDPACARRARRRAQARAAALLAALARRLEPARRDRRSSASSATSTSSTTPTGCTRRRPAASARRPCTTSCRSASRSG